MDKLSATLYAVDANGIAFWCPGCRAQHVVTIGAGAGAWKWNGSVERPTFHPSVLASYPHWEPSAEDPEVAAAIKRGEVKQQLVERKCHSFVTDGQIQFLGDCTHELAGQTVPLPDFDAA